MWIGKDVTGSFPNQFGALCELGNMIDDDILT
jgi:hypothetical protein